MHEDRRLACQAPDSTRPPGVSTRDPPLPGWPFARREVVVVAAGEGLERDQGRVVFEQDLCAAGGLDLVLLGAAAVASPAEAGAVEPVDDFDPALGAAPVDDLGEGGGAPARGGQVGAGGDGAALAPAAAEVD